jgi:integrase
LSISNVNLREGFIRIEASKNREPREVPLTPNLRVLLEAVIRGKSKNEPLCPAKTMRHAWKRLCKRAGLKSGLDGYVIHDTRRTAARTKRSAGVSETVTSKIMGWKPGSKMFARYGIVDRNDMREALERTEKHEQVLLESRKVRAEFGQNQIETAPEPVQTTSNSQLPN